ncbi:hypothetical protein [Actinocrinis sp.]|uniref:hypothetical protein n=1 Tax=Actinocrinis sp. TaxID=1920516 RepID=UPI002DDD6F4C|nr:hypothetical protein [Actinocrinis sp.]
MVRDFLLEFMVREVTLALGDVPSVVPGLCAWFGYLADTGQLDPRGPSAARLVEFAEAHAARAEAAMGDPEQWGIAKFWMTTALERGVDLEDERALNRFLQSARDGRVDGVDEELVGRIAERHRERALFEQFGIGGSGRSAQSAQTGPRTMRQLPVVLASRGELAVAAARVAFVRDMRAFVDWVGDSRKLKADGKLRAADVREAATALRPDDEDAPEPAVGLLSAWALAARLVKVRKGELSRVKSAAGTLRDEVKLWDRAFGAVADLGAELLPGDSFLGRGLALLLPDVLAALYSLEEPAELGMLRFSVRQAAEPTPLFGLAPGPLSSTDRAAVDHEFDRLLEFLRGVGAVEFYRGRGRSKKPDAAVRAADAAAVALTPLGTFGVYRILKDLGRHLPVVGELTGADASGLLSVLYDEYTPDTASKELGLWRGAQASREEADDLLRQALRRVPFEERRYGMLHMLFEALPEADGEAFVRSLRADPLLGAPALGLLLEAGLESPDEQAPGEIAAAMVGTLAALAGSLGPEGLVEQLRGMELELQEALVDALADLPHPRSFELLDVIAVHHPDRRIAKRARKNRIKVMN